MHAILLNIRHGGGHRAQALLEWITARSPDVVVLPEWRDNSAGDVLRRGLEAKGLQVATATLSNKSNGILLAAKRPFEFYCGTPVEAMNGALIVGNFGSECRVLAAYFPQGKAKVPFFKFCLGEAEAAHNVPFVLLGDLNTGRNDADVEEWGVPFVCADEFEELETKAGLVDLWRSEHRDKREWSWQSPLNGFRVDHALGNEAFRKQFPNVRCFYDHVPRATNLTDHSALILTASDTEI
jgi:exonuclease III